MTQSQKNTIESLRAEGLTYDKIASALNVSSHFPPSRCTSAVSRIQYRVAINAIVGLMSRTGKHDSALLPADASGIKTIWQIRPIVRSTSGIARFVGKCSSR